MGNIEDILPRYCEGTTSVRENRIVEAWLEESEENRQIAAQIASIVLDDEALKKMKSCNVEDALRCTKKKIAYRRFVSYGIKTLRYAACVAAFVFAALWGMEKYSSIDEIVEISTRPGMIGRVTLPDGTKVVLNSSTTLKYPVKFGDRRRDVILQGEGYFEVKKDSGRPFYVTTPAQTQIKVYGTRFNVDAYNAEECTATLIDGSIGFIYTDNMGEIQEVRLEPSQILEYNPATGAEIHSCNYAARHISWTQNKIYLDRTPLRKIFDELGKRYDVEFVVEDKNVLENVFSGGYMTIHNLESTLMNLQLASDMKWDYAEHVVNNHIIITID